MSDLTNIKNIETVINPKPNIKPTQKPKHIPYAFATLVMIDPKYAIGAITLAQSLTMTNTKFDIVCMATPDIYDDDIIYNLLIQHFNYVVKVEYIQLSTKPFSDKRKETYPWIDKSYTKLSAMLLDRYEKVCMLDSDMVIIHNIDHLFKLQTPVGVFSNHWFDRIKPTQKYFDSKSLQSLNLKDSINKKINIPKINKKTCNYYWDIKPFDKIEPMLIYTALNNNGFVASGNLFIINPNKNEFYEMIHLLNQKQPFGFNCSSGADEQSICYYQSIVKNRSWTCLKHGYNIIPWKLKQTLSMYKPFVFHFNMTPKPWDIKRGRYIDIEIWWAFAKSIYNISEICLKLMIEYDEDFESKYCPFCLIMKVKKIKHPALECILDIM